ncbi:hypothetical protein HGRIS_011440 [Hohenbuehelia grisea]|uniref:Uncharacterized protein n=1 Tax=Hohenbuehelia grisea TaxID=104357 RepID=A0ABR3JV21_9AGAR
MSAPIAGAHIKDSVLDYYEVDTQLIDLLIGHTFEGAEEAWNRKSGHQSGSPVQQWYRRMASGDSAFTQRSQGGPVPGRIIAWKKGTPFAPRNIFFRALDTGRLLPMSSAVMRLQAYALPSFWEFIDTKPAPQGSGMSNRQAYLAHVVTSILHELLFLRSMHDMNAADIPLLIVSWDDDAVARAIQYWSDLSKGEWS